MDRDEPTGAAVDFIEHAVGKGSGESACQFYGKVGNDYAHAFRVAAAARHVSYDMCVSALTPSGRSTAAGEFELLGGGNHLLGVSEFLDGWLESDFRRASPALRVCVGSESQFEAIDDMAPLRSDQPAARVCAVNSSAHRINGGCSGCSGLLGCMVSLPARVSSVVARGERDRAGMQPVCFSRSWAQPECASQRKQSELAAGRQCEHTELAGVRACMQPVCLSRSGAQPECPSQRKQSEFAAGRQCEHPELAGVSS
jgi:hypothetical protein